MHEIKDYDVKLKKLMLLVGKLSNITCINDNNYLDILRKDMVYMTDDKDIVTLDGEVLYHVVGDDIVYSIKYGKSDIVWIRHSLNEIIIQVRDGKTVTYKSTALIGMINDISYLNIDFNIKKAPTIGVVLCRRRLDGVYELIIMMENEEYIIQIDYYTAEFIRHLKNKNTEETEELVNYVKFGRWILSDSSTFNTGTYVTIIDMKKAALLDEFKSRNPNVKVEAGFIYDEKEWKFDSEFKKLEDELGSLYDRKESWEILTESNNENYGSVITDKDGKYISSLLYCVRPIFYKGEDIVGEAEVTAYRDDKGNIGFINVNRYISELLEVNYKGGYEECSDIILTRNNMMLYDKKCCIYKQNGSLISFVNKNMRSYEANFRIIQS